MAQYGWQLVQTSPAPLTETDIKDLTIKHEVDALDNAQVVCQKKFAVGTMVTLANSTTNILYGKVTACNKTELNQYQISIVETGVELRSILMQTTLGGRVVTITNPLHTRTITSYVTEILYGSGWTDGTLDPATTDPIRHLALPDMKFSNMYVISGLEKFIKLTLGYMIWFDYSLKKVYYGDKRVDRTASIVNATDVNLLQQDTFQAVTEVIIIGKSSAVYGRAVKVGAVPPYKTLQYQLTDYKDDTELTSVAYQVLKDKQDATMDRYEVVITTETYLSVGYRAGDRVHVVWALDGYDFTGVVKDITVGMEVTTLGVGSKEITIFDLLSNKLQLISGFSFVGVDMVYSGGWQNISKEDGASWYLTITDIDKLGDFNLYLTIDKWKTQAEIDDANALVGIGTGHATVGVGSTSAVVNVATGYAQNSTGTGNANPINADQSIVAGYFYAKDQGYTDVSLVSGSWVNLTPSYLYTTTLTYGTWFGWTSIYVKIRDQSGVGNSGYTFRVLRWNGSTWDVVTQAIAVYAYCNTADTYHDISVTIGVLGHIYTGTHTYKVEVYSSQASCVVKGWGVYLQLLPRHTHTATDSGHSNHAVADSGHAQAGSSPAHPHIGSDTGHADHPATPTPHDHTVSPVETLKTYPGPLSVLVYNSLYPAGHLIVTDVGGAAKTITLTDIGSHLATGANRIYVSSGAAGSGWIHGDFVSYGEGE